MQSVFIHTMPALLTWCTRWYGQQDLFGGGGGGGWGGEFFGGGGGGGVGGGKGGSGVSQGHMRLSVEQLERPMGRALSLHVPHISTCCEFPDLLSSLNSVSETTDRSPLTSRHGGSVQSEILTRLGFRRVGLWNFEMHSSD